MEVSKLTISDNLKTQVSTKMQILKWLQRYPAVMRDTSIPRIAKALATSSALSTGVTYNTIRLAMNDLYNKDFLRRSGTAWRATYRINYLNTKLPKDFIESASAEERKVVEEAKNRVEAIVSQEDNLVSDNPGMEVVPVKNTKEISISANEAEPVEIKTDVNGITLNINLTIKLER